MKARTNLHDPFLQRLHDNYYSGVYVPDEAIATRRARRVQLEAEFKRDAFAHLGITNHPRAEKLYEVAYKMSHGYSWHEIYLMMTELMELLP